MSLQYEPASDPNWDHLRRAIASARGEIIPPPKPPDYSRFFEIVALAVLTLGLGVLVKVEWANLPHNAVTYGIERLEEQITGLAHDAVDAMRSVVNAQPETSKPTPKVSKPKNTSMLDASDDAPPVANNQIRVEESIKELPKFQVEIVERNHRRILTADDKHMMVEIAEPGATSVAGDPLTGRIEPVVLRAHINTDGAIDSLTKLSGPAALTTAAIETVKGLHYQPMYRDGAAVDSETDITVKFVPTK